MLTRSRFTFPRAFHNSYSACINIQLSGERPNALDNLNAIAGDILVANGFSGFCRWHCWSSLRAPRFLRGAAIHFKNRDNFSR